MVLLAALEQFEYQGINRLLLAVLGEYEDSGTTQEEDVNIKMLPSSQTKHCMCFVVNGYNKKCEVENEN